VIVRVSRGLDMVGVMRYLAGPGKANEHTEPHLVAGDGAVLAWWDDTALDRAAAQQIGAHLDEPHRELGVDVSGGHVWHCSLSLPPEDGQLSDERWAAITAEFVDEMGFTPASGKAGCRWVAVRHGVSRNGNDHVHLVVSLVRDDGTKAWIGNDWIRAGAAAQGIEQRHGLRVLEARAAGRGSRGVTAAEVNKTARLGVDEPERLTVARRVRAYAAASADEAEFVRRARAGGLLIRPRYAAGRGDVVAGYSVAVKPARGERPIWFGGGRLDRDLTLPRLRETWPDSPQSASAAVAEWTAAARHRRPAATGAETRQLDPDELHEAAGEIAALREQLRATPVDDRAGWASVAHDSAGVFAAWSTRLESGPGPLAATAAELARSAQLHAAATVRRPPAAGRGTGARRAAALLLQASGATPQRTGELLLLRQLGNTMKSLHDAHQAAGGAQAAAGLAAVARGELVDIRDRYTATTSFSAQRGNRASVVVDPTSTAPSIREGRLASPASNVRSTRGQRMTDRDNPRPATPLPPPLRPGRTVDQGGDRPAVVAPERRPGFGR
jgi:hypothetical protein